MRINHNSLALNASDHFATINSNISKSMSKLSSGNKITSPSDDAAGLAISTKMSAQIRGLNRAARNSSDGISVIQSSESGLNEIHSILGRMRELAVQAANDVNYEDDRDSIQLEIEALQAEINQIVDTTAFNEQKLLNGNISRRTLSSEYNIQATYVSEEVPVGVYDIEVTKDATHAVLATGINSGIATITEDTEGTILVNDFAVQITEGMTASDVYEALQVHLNKIGIDVIASNDGGDTATDFTTGAPVYFVSKGYGSTEKIDIKIANPLLAGLLGIADGTSEAGEDCEVSLTVSSNGFTNTATYKSDGNTINIVDRNGFEMRFEIQPDTLKSGNNVASVEVLSAGTMVIQSGANSGEQIEIDIPSLDTKSLGIDDIIIYTHDYAGSAITAIDEAVKLVSKIRSKLGAYENRLDDVTENLAAQEESITAAYSRIMDTDMAEEMTNYTQQDVLAQAAISMMKKSNERPESILQLLQ